MPLLSQSIIVGGGVEFTLPITVGQIPRVASVGPPGSLTNSIMRQWADGAVSVITIGAVDVRAGVGATETFRLRGGIISEGAAVDSFVAGRGASVSVAGIGNIAIGWDAQANETFSTAIGGGGAFSANQAVALGYSAFANDDGVTIGYGAFGSRDDVCIGSQSFDEDECVVIGAFAEAGNTGQVVIGFGALGAPNTFDEYSVIIGWGSSGNHRATAIGYQATANGDNGLILGYDSQLDGDFSIGIGGGLRETMSNTAFLGGPLNDVQTLVIGNGDDAISPAVRSLRFTNGSGVDNAAGAASIVAPRSTGAAASAALAFGVGIPAASGAAVQAIANAARVSHTVAAGQTMLEIFDVDSAGLSRVLVGAAGTGPGGVGRALYLA